MRSTSSTTSQRRRSSSRPQVTPNGPRGRQHLHQRRETTGTDYQRQIEVLQGMNADAGFKFKNNAIDYTS